MEYKFNKLTPTNDSDNLDKSRIDALKFAIEDKDIKNVAISGNYGSGKSSFIETYKTKNKNFNPIHISLAHFSNSYVDSENIILKNGIGNQVNVLEGKIINQLLHQINSKNIPLTIFKSKQNPNKGNIWKWAGYLIALLLPSLFLINYTYLASLLRESFSWLPNWGAVTRLIAIVIIIFGLCFMIYKLVKLQFHNKLLKTIEIKRGGVLLGRLRYFKIPMCLILTNI